MNKVNGAGEKVAAQKFKPREHLFYKHIKMLIDVKNYFKNKPELVEGADKNIKEIIGDEIMQNFQADLGLLTTAEQLVPFMVPDLPIAAQGLTFYQSLANPAMTIAAMNIGPRKMICCEFDKNAMTQLEKELSNLLDKIYPLREKAPRVIIPGGIIAG